MFQSAGYPKRFISATVDSFLNQPEEKLIPDYLFEERRKIYIQLPYCKKNEALSKNFISKLNIFTNFRYSFIIYGKLGKLRAFLNLNIKMFINRMWSMKVNVLVMLAILEKQ